MLENNVFYQKQRDKMADTIWLMQQRSRTLQEYRRNTEQLWNDDASKDIKMRYLNPHETDSNTFCDLLKDQQNQLQEADKKMEQASALAIEINQLSTEVNRLIDITNQEMQRAYYDYNIYQENYGSATDKFPQIQQLINQANNACG